MKMKLVIFCLLLCSPVFSFIMNTDEVKLNTKIGAIIGKLEKVTVSRMKKKEIAVFLGIPYAEPPVGTLR